MQRVEQDLHSLPETALLKFVNGRKFNFFFYSIIFLNSLVLSIPNYAAIDENGDLRTESSLRNAIFVYSEVGFLILFSIELLFKLSAYGLHGKDSYFVSPWNGIDFIVVVGGWIAYGLPQGGNFVTILRLVRVFRPLRSLAASKELRKVVSIVIESIPGLANVFVIACFALLFFSIAGLQFFMGPDMHSRCRLTPFPVHSNWTVGSSLDDNRCLEAENIDIASWYPQLKKSSSPWATRLADCYWPVDPSNTRFCSLSSSSGLNVCHHDTNVIPESAWTWCGSNYDGFGNARFADREVMLAPDYVQSLLWGHSNYDNVFRAFLTVFEVVSLNHWVNIMYMMQDTFGRPIAIYFIFVDLIGTYIVLNLILTSINATIVAYQLDEKNGSSAETENSPGQPEEASENGDQDGNSSSFIDWKIERLRPVVQHRLFKLTSLALILINSVLLSIYHFPAGTHVQDSLEGVYFIFVMIFMVELLLRISATGMRTYFSKSLSILDFCVVSLSFIEAYRFPPVVIGGPGYTNQFKGREFGMGFLGWRMVRVLNFAVEYFDLIHIRLFVKQIGKTIADCLAFSVVFMLYIYVCALIGMQCFANKLRFDELGYPIPVTDREAWLKAPERPRSNFDDFFLSIGTVFQIVTSENWYEVMDDVWRSQGSGAASFVIIVLVLGLYVLLSQLLTLIVNDIAESFSEVRKSLATPRPTLIGAEAVTATPQPPPPESQQLSPQELRTDLTHSTVYDKIATDDDFADSNPFAGKLSSKSIVAKEDNESSQSVVSATDILNLSGIFWKLNGDNWNHQLNYDEFGEKDGGGFSTSNPTTPTKHISEMGRIASFGIEGPYDPAYDVEANGAMVKGVTYADVDADIRPEGRGEGGVYWWLHTVCEEVHNAFWYNTLSAAMALFSAVQLAVDSPLMDPSSPNARVMLILNSIFTVYVCLENIIDIIGEGPTRYFSSAWNWGDFAVTVVCVVGMCIANQAMIGVRVLKALRTLIAIQRIEFFNGIKNTLKAMQDVIPRAAFVSLFFSCTLFFFAVFMVSSLSGQLRTCEGEVFEHVITSSEEYAAALSEPQAWAAMSEHAKEMFGPHSAVFEHFGVSTEATEVCGATWPSQPCCMNEKSFSLFVGEPLAATSRSYCECWGGSWIPETVYLFDNVPQAFYTLFQMSTLEGWVELKSIVVDTRGIDMQPLRDNHTAWIFFFIAFIAVSNFLFLELFIAEVVRSFNENLPSEEKHKDEFTKQIGVVENIWMVMFKTSGQQELMKVETSKRLLKLWDLPMGEKEWVTARHPIQVFAAAVSQDPVFDTCMVIIVILNTVVLAMPYFGASDEYLKSLELANTIFAVIFNFELLINATAQGLYILRDPFSLFDVIIVLGTDVQLISSLYISSTSSKAVSLGRMLRMLKIVRMLKLPQSQRLLEVLYSFLPNIRNIGVFLFFMVAIFSVIGVQSFGKTAYNGRYDEYANFRSIDVALLTMFRFLSDQYWNDFMHDAAFQTAGCVNDPPYDPAVCGFSEEYGCAPLNGCGSAGIYPFMTAYMLVVNFCCMSLFVAVIIDGLSTYAEESMFSKIDRAARGRVVACWLKYDKEASGFISVPDLEKLLVDEDNPFALFVAYKPNSTADVVQSWSKSTAESVVNNPLQDAIDVLPFAVKMNKGCLFSEVFKVLYLSGDSKLVKLYTGTKMDLEAKTVLGREWLSLKEHYAAVTIVRYCERHQTLQKKSRKVQLIIKRKAWRAYVQAMSKSWRQVGIKTIRSAVELPSTISNSFMRNFSDALNAVTPTKLGRLG